MQALKMTSALIGGEGNQGKLYTAAAGLGHSEYRILSAVNSGL